MINIELDYQHKLQSANSDKLILLLHGFAQDHQWIFSQLQPELPSDVNILAVSAPFPFPSKKDDKWTMGYSWYFFNVEEKHFYTPISTAVDYLLQVLKDLKLSNKQTTVIGYSQGGYVSPYLATKLEQTEQVIVLNGRYRHEDLILPKKIRFDAIHGEKDKSVECASAHDSYQQLQDRFGFAGEFVKLGAKGHRLDSEFFAKTRELLLIK